MYVHAGFICVSWPGGFWVVLRGNLRISVEFSRLLVPFQYALLST